jgi:3-(3-hydroxy-phenyl)propionate hydroxylase
VKATTATAIALGRVICERDLERATARDARLLAENDGEIRTTFRQNMIPDLNCGIVAADTPGAGSLFPQPRVIADGAPAVLLDELTGPQIRVVVNGDLTDIDAEKLLGALRPLSARVIALGATKSDLGPDVLRVHEDGAVVAPWLATLGMRVAVVRPDHYVYGTAADVNGALVLIERFRNQLGCAA